MNVFILDDHAPMLEVLSINFELSGHETTVSTDNYDPPPGFDAYLIDVGLPGENGIDVARRLMGRAPDAFIILFSAYDREHIEAWGGGEFLFISKMTDVCSVPTLVESCVRAEQEARAS